MCSEPLDPNYASIIILIACFDASPTSLSPWPPEPTAIPTRAAALITIWASPLWGSNDQSVHPMALRRLISVGYEGAKYLNHIGATESCWCCSKRRNILAWVTSLLHIYCELLQKRQVLYNYCMLCSSKIIFNIITAVALGNAFVGRWFGR